MAAALADDAHADAQRARYAARRARLRPALERRAGRSSTPRPACTCGRRTRTWTAGRSVQRLAEAGILVAPGEFYGPAGARHIRVALTATDERIDAAVARLASLTQPYRYRISHRLSNDRGMRPLPAPYAGLCASAWARSEGAEEVHRRMPDSETFDAFYARTVMERHQSDTRTGR